MATVVFTTTFSRCEFRHVAKLEVTQCGDRICASGRRQKKAVDDVTRPWSVKDVSEGEEMDNHSEDRLLVLLVSLLKAATVTTFVFMLTEHSLFSMKMVTDSLPLPLQRGASNERIALLQQSWFDPPDPLLRKRKNKFHAKRVTCFTLRLLDETFDLNSLNSSRDNDLQEPKIKIIKRIKSEAVEIRRHS